MSRWLLVTNGRVIDGLGNPPVDDCNVLIKDNRIHAVGADATAEAVPRGEPLETINATGRTVMPGLIDAHCHMTYGESRTEEEIDLYTSPEMRTLLAAHNVEKVLRSGVTSISQPGGSYFIGVGIRDGIKRGIIHGPRMTAAGRYLTTSNGLTDWYPDSVGVPAGNIGRLTNTVDEMKSEIRHQVKNGVDLIKCADSPFGDYQAFTDDEMKIMADLTHQLKKKITIHARGASEVRAAANARYDWIMHGNMLDDAAIEALVESQVPLVPTLLLLANMSDYRRQAMVPTHQADAVQRMLDKTAASLTQAYEAGVKFAMGTDSGFAVTAFGEWHARELELLVDYTGMSNLEAIKAGTSGCAVTVNLEGQVGGVVEGWLADLIIVDGDPSVDLSVLYNPHKILTVILDGEVQVFAEDLRQQIFQHDRLPHEYGFERLTWERAVAGADVDVEVGVPWGEEQRSDLVADTQRTEAASRADAEEKYTGD